MLRFSDTSNIPVNKAIRIGSAYLNEIPERWDNAGMEHKATRSRRSIINVLLMGNDNDFVKDIFYIFILIPPIKVARGMG